MAIRSAFQRRHYQAVAAILFDAYRQTSGDMFTQTVVDVLIQSFARMFRADNPRFSRERFETACRQ